MRGEDLTIEEKVDRLAEQIENLARRVAALEGSKALPVAGPSADAPAASPGTVVPQAIPPRPGKPPD
jgi:hypothetical protein